MVTTLQTASGNHSAAQMHVPESLLAMMQTLSACCPHSDMLQLTDA